MDELNEKMKDMEHYDLDPNASALAKYEAKSTRKQILMSILSKALPAIYREYGAIFDGDTGSYLSKSYSFSLPY